LDKQAAFFRWQIFHDFLHDLSHFLKPLQLEIVDFPDLAIIRCFIERVVAHDNQGFLSRGGDLLSYRITSRAHLLELFS
jgi:hypothetical protein